MNSQIALVVAWQSSSCTEWPTLWITLNLNRPCICATINLLSNLSFSAVNKIFDTFTFKKESLSPSNHPFQNFSLSYSGTFQPSTFLPSFFYSYCSWAGIDILALYLFFNVWEARDQAIAYQGQLKSFGLLFSRVIMKGSASRAVPSTTSMTTNPLTCPPSSGLTLSTIREAIDPPSECPTTMKFCAANFFVNTSRADSHSFTNVSMDMSKGSFYIFDMPWPRQSIASTVLNFFAYLAKVANERAEWPAPWIQKSTGPQFPALNTEVPQQESDIFKIKKLIKEQVPGIRCQL